MASIHLVNALYGNKPDAPKMSPGRHVANMTQSVTTPEHSSTDVEMSCTDIVSIDQDVKDQASKETSTTEQPATMQSVTSEQSRSDSRQLSVGSDGIHPARQHIINLKGCSSVSVISGCG